MVRVRHPFGALAALLAVWTCAGPAAARPPVAGAAASTPSAATSAAGPLGPADVVTRYRTSLGLYSAEWPGILASLMGPVQVELRLRTEGRRVAQVVDARCEALQLGPVQLGRASLQFAAAGSDAARSLVFDLEGPLAARVHLELRGDVDFELATLRPHLGPGEVTGALTVEGLDLGATLGPWFPWLGLEGKLALQARIAGRGAAPEVSLEVHAADLRRGPRPIAPIRLVAHAGAGRGSLDLTWGEASAPLGQLSGELGLDLDLVAGTLAWRDADPLQAQLRLRGLESEQLAGVFGQPPLLSYRFDLDVSATGRLAALQTAGHLTGTLGPTPELQWPLQGSWSGTSREHRLELALGEVATGQATLTADLVALRRGSGSLGAAALRGELRLDLPLEGLGPWLPAALADARGLLRGQASLGGTLAQPTFDGGLDVADASVTVIPLTTRLHGLALHARLSGDTLRVEGLEAVAGEGRLSGEGWLTLRGAGGARFAPWRGWGVDGAGALSLERIPLVQQDLPIGELRGQVAVTLEAAPGETTVQLRLRSGELELGSDSLPSARAIPSNPSVLDQDGNSSVAAGQWLRGDGRLRLGFLLEQPLRVRGPGIELALTGRLDLERAGPLAHSEGALQALPGGRIRLFGNSFDIYTGTIRFYGGDLRRAELDPSSAAARQATLRDPDRPTQIQPLEPVLDFVAQGRVVDTSVLVEVFGPSRRPQLVLASSPALPEYQILTLLILGRVDTVDERNGEVRRQVAALVGRFHNPSLKRQLFDRLGVDNLGVGFGSSVSQPILTVGKQISRQLYVETTYRHNASPDENGKEAHIEYRLDPHWTVDTVYGDAAEGSAGLFWAFSFGGPPAPPPPASPADFARNDLRPPADRDLDGVADEDDRCPRDAEDPDLYDDEDGCPDPDNDGDQVPDEVDVAPLLPEVANGYRDGDGAPDLPPLPYEDFELTVAPLLFARGAVRPSKEHAARLQALAETVRRQPGLRLELRAYDDGRSGLRDGASRAGRRAAETALALFRLGVAPERVRLTSVPPRARGPRQASRVELGALLRAGTLRAPVTSPPSTGAAPAAATEAPAAPAPAAAGRSPLPFPPRVR